LHERHKAEDLKDQDIAIEVCETMMDKLHLREFISSKAIAIKTAVNIHIEKNGKGVFMLREKAKEEKRKPQFKPRKLRMGLTEFNEERLAKRSKLGDAPMPDAFKTFEQVIPKTQAFSQSQGQDEEDFSSL
jgi:hypothetical protein